MLQILINGQLMFEGEPNKNFIIPSVGEVLLFKTFRENESFKLPIYDIYCYVEKVIHTIQPTWNKQYKHTIEIHATEEARVEVKF